MADAAGLLILLAVAAASLVALLTIALVRGMRHPHRRTVAYAVARNLPCDPEERGLMYEAWTLRRSGRGGGDVTLAVWEVQGRGGADAAPLTAVFLHGWGQSCLDTLRTIEPWPDLVARMVLYDLRGHGESGGPSRVGIGEEDDLAALLDELGPGPFVLVGRSLGGGIAWRQAARDERVAGLVLLAPVFDLRDATRRRLHRSGYPAWPIAPLAFAWLRLCGLPARPLDASLAPPVPTLIVCGEHDDIVPPSATAPLAESSERVTRVVIEGAGHADLEEHGPDVIANSIRAFVESIRRA